MLFYNSITSAELERVGNNLSTVLAFMLLLPDTHLLLSATLFFSNTLRLHHNSELISKNRKSLVRLEISHFEAVILVYLNIAPEVIVLFQEEF